jgi:protocatechuate 3,4-dioxygenase beta subunit
MVTGAGVSSKPLEAGTGLILGRVVEAGTTTPVPDAMVTLTGGALGVSGQRFANGVAAGPRVTVTDSTGRFLFRDLPVGNYQITAAAQGFSSAGYQQAKPNQVRRSLELPRPVELAPGEKRGDVVINLWRHAGITGTVLDEAGEPVVGLTVSVLTRTLVSGKPVMQNYATAVTDDRGIYWAEVVPGDYVVGVLTAPTTLPNALLDEWAQVRAEGGDAVAAFAGRLFAAGLNLPAVAGVRMGAVTVTSSRPGWIAPPLTTSDGRLFAYPTTFHPAALSAATAAIVTVRSAEEKPGINIQVTPRPLLRVSGRLLGPEGPMPGVVVRLITIDPATTMSSPPSQIDEATAMTGADGRFIFPGVAPGQYRIRMLQAPSQGRAAAPTWWALQNVTVGDDDIDGLDITAKRGARFSGRVVFEGAPPPGITDALRNVTVSPRAVPGTNGSLALATGAATVAATGEFSSPEFVPGPYVLDATNVPFGWIVKSVMAGTADAADVPVELPEGGLDNIVVTLTDKIAYVTGIVRGSSDKAAGNATVGVFPVDRTMWRRVGMQSRRTQTFIPLRNGVFLITGLPPGEYYIIATEGEIPDFSDPVVLTSLIPPAVKITIAPGEKKSVELRSVIRK